MYATYSRLLEDNKMVRIIKLVCAFLPQYYSSARLHISHVEGGFVESLNAPRLD
jgi:hypothetical protein